MGETERGGDARSSDLSESQLQTLCAALGWQGGTYWQVVDEIRRLREESDASDELRTRLGHLLTGVANALRGPPPPLTLWSWHDLPERAAAAIAAIDVMTRAAKQNAAPGSSQSGQGG